MNLIRLYGELKAESALISEKLEKLNYYGENEKYKVESALRKFKIANLIYKTEERLSNKYNIKF